MKTPACAFLVLASACASLGPPPGVVEDLNGQIDHLDVEETAHIEALQAAASVAEAIGIEQEHRGHIEVEFEAIRADLDVLSRCRARPAVPLDTSAVHALIQDIRAGEADHQVRLERAVDLVAVTDEANRHNESFRASIQLLRSQRDDLSGRAESADCT